MFNICISGLVLDRSMVTRTRLAGLLRLRCVFRRMERRWCLCSRLGRDNLWSGIGGGCGRRFNDCAIHLAELNSKSGIVQSSVQSRFLGSLYKISIRYIFLRSGDGERRDWTFIVAV